MWTNNHWLSRHGIFIKGRECRIEKDDLTFLIDIPGRAKSNITVYIFSCSVDPASLCTIERQLLSIHGKEILSEEFAQMFKQISEPTDYRIIAAYGMFGLSDVCYVHHEDTDQNKQQDKNKGQRQIDESFAGKGLDGHRLFHCCYYSVYAVFTLDPSERKYNDSGDNRTLHSPP